MFSQQNLGFDYDVARYSAWLFRWLEFDSFRTKGKVVLLDFHVTFESSPVCQIDETKLFEVGRIRWWSVSRFFFFFVWHRVCFTYFASPIEQSAIIHLNYSLLVFSQTPSSTSVYLYRLEHVCIVESWRDDGKDSTEAREIQLVLRYLHNFLQQIWPVDLDRRVSTDVSNSKLDLQSYSTEIVSSLDGN